ncbi:MAG: recombination protein RecR, partial [Verrucomicrobiota bacterium]
MDYPTPIKRLIAQFKQLPGIGPKSAERIAVWMIQQGRELSPELANALNHANTSVTECGTCGFFLEAEAGCHLCDSPVRDTTQLCIVEQPTDVLPIERSGAYRGHYHVL